MEQKAADVRVNGDGSVAGGVYGDVTINGAGTVAADIVADAVRINGAASCRGTVRAGLVAVNGAGTFEGSVQATEMTVNGSADVRAGLGVGKLRVTGTMGVDGGVAAHEVELRGEIKVGADLEAEKFTGEGRFVVNGLLNAETVDIKLHGRSSAREIGGERVTTRTPEGITSLFSMFADRRLVVDVIEADDVSLVNTTAKVVRGARVALGEGCEVGLVEYTERLDRMAGAKVDEERKVEASAS